MSAKTEPSSPISDDIDTKPSLSTPLKQKRKAGSGSTPTLTSSSKKTKTKSSPATNIMTPEIKEALINHMMRIACSAVQKDQLAAEVRFLK
jgi:hypothetical protein